MYSQLTENLREHQALRDEEEQLSGGEPLSSDPLDLDILPVSSTRDADREGSSTRNKRAAMLAA